MRSSLLRRRYRLKKEITLNLTAFVDVLTNILIFLIINVSIEPPEIDAARDIQLPISTTHNELRKGVAVIITLNDVQVDGNQIVSFPAGTSTANVLTRNSDILALQDALKKAQQERVKAIKERKSRATDAEGREKEKAKAEEEQIPAVLIQADKRLDYDAVNRVVTIAGHAGFGIFRFAVLEQ